MNSSTHIKRLEDVAYLAGRIGWKGLTAKEYTQEGPYFLSVHGLNYGAEVDFRDANHISQARYDESPEIMLREGDVLICKDGAGIGKTGIVGKLLGPATINSSLLLIRAGETLLPKFLYYYLSSPAFQALVQEKIDGATTPHLYQREIRQFPIPILSLDEQRRLITVLDQAFEGVARARRNAECNLANARELFFSTLKHKISGIASTSELLTLADIAKDFGRGRSRRRPRNDPSLYGGMYPFIQTGDVRNSGHFITTYTQTYNGAGLAQSKLWPTGTICITIAANIAETGVLTFDACFPDSVIGVVVDLQKATSGYVEYVLQYFKAELQAKGKGSAQDNINLGTFENARFPFPDLTVQREIESHLSELEVLRDDLVSSYQARLTALIELEQSIMQKAFAGELAGKKAIVASVQFSSSADTVVPAFTADILALAYSKHQSANRSRTFGRVKGQKVLHLVESIGGVELGRTPIKDAAGPNDSAQMRRAEAWAAENDYFTFVQRSGGGYDFVKGRSFDRLYAGALARLATQRSEIGRIVDLLVPMDSEEAEVFATVHAAWNNLLLDGKQPTDAEILYEARENWHASKLKIPQSKFLNALRLIKTGQLVPTGSGKRVGGQEALL